MKRQPPPTRLRSIVDRDRRTYKPYKYYLPISKTDALRTKSDRIQAVQPDILKFYTEPFPQYASPLNKMFKGTEWVQQKKKPKNIKFRRYEPWEK